MSAPRRWGDRWTAEQDAVIRALAPELGFPAAARALGVSRRAAQGRGAGIGVAGAFGHGGARRGHHFTPAEDAAIRSLYPAGGARAVAAATGLPQQSIRGRAKWIGVRRVRRPRAGEVTS